MTTSNKTDLSASMLSLSDLAPVPGSKHRRKRIGFGEGSGRGKTSGKGNKGARARSGYHSKPGFEGGQMPLHRRLPKRGFTSRKKVVGENVFSLVSLEQINKMIADNASLNTFSIEFMRERGLLKSSAPKVKILGKGTVNSKVTIEAHAASAGAREAIEGAGGVLTLV